jgi:hypothetical protein
MFKDFCQQIRIKVTFTSIYHLQSNGIVERANTLIYEGIKKILEGEKKANGWRSHQRLCGVSTRQFAWSNIPSFHYSLYLVIYSASFCNLWESRACELGLVRIQIQTLFSFFFQIKSKESLYGNFNFRHTTMPSVNSQSRREGQIRILGNLSDFSKPV